MAFIHFSMISGGSLKPQSDEIQISDEHIPNFIQALKQDKLTISKSLLKAIYWAMTLPNSKLIFVKHSFID